MYTSPHASSEQLKQKRSSEVVVYFITLIDHQSSEYERAVAFRSTILREPLGLEFSAQDLAAEHDQLHYAMFDPAGEIIATVVLKLAGEEVAEMRQVAVADSQRGGGLGKRLANHVEQEARARGYNKMQVHAREVALPFYLACGYRVVSERYERVTLPHFLVVKDL